MSEYNISFSATSSHDGGSFKLIELPPELLNLVESAIENANPLSLAIKGQQGEDAVLCTSNKTYAMRSTVLSNTVLVVAPPSDVSREQFEDDDTVVIRDQVNEVVELVPAVPKLHKLGAVLRGREYNEGEADRDEDDASHPWEKYTYDDARVGIQASDDELHRGLRERHILNINGELRPIAPAYLSTILELLLNLLVSLSLPHAAAEVEKLSSSLADDHEIPRAVSTQVMSWFGEMKGGTWKVNVEGMVRAVGLGVLKTHKGGPIEKDAFLAKWKTLVGDTFEASVSLNLLAGDYLASTSTINNTVALTYFPASALPVEPAPRFADLFLTRSRWKGDEISPFLTDIAVNSKERDKLLLKYARAVTDARGVWYTARAQYNG